MSISKEEIERKINEKSNEILQEGRNFIVKTRLDNGQDVVIKSFKKPNAINRYAYRYIRKSKAQRSFEYAHKLEALGIGTPKPITYVEKYQNGALNISYYVSEYQPYDLTYRELVDNPNYLDYEIILRQFTQFTYQLHEKGIEFKDHSPGNTLIEKIGEGQYRFYLVDLNRMNFHEEMSFQQRMYNMRRLTPQREMVEIMADEYAQLSGEPYEKVFSKMWEDTKDFQKKHRRKQNLKKKLKGK